MNDFILEYDSIIQRITCFEVLCHQTKKDSVIRQSSTFQTHIYQLQFTAPNKQTGATLPCPLRLSVLVKTTRTRHPLPIPVLLSLSVRLLLPLPPLVSGKEGGGEWNAC
ncbi:hypothetical protein CEXT_68341 [Caerostris extrusa]|uniref:Uncharacterized protein n=1 Tax=Caerostris extrusa TaxID=172846 RepID=A0AAV4T6C1_CAEEX|nr:hypothetical protein CEXT_68341 [Caerostris extrusa]